MSPPNLNTDSIVNAGIEHSKVLAELHSRCFYDAPWDALSISRILLQEPNNGLIYCVKNVPIGFVLWQMVAGEAEILTICIDPKWQRQGYSRPLVDEMLRILSHEQVSSLYLEVSEDNFSAICLYLNVGFKEVGRRAKYYRKEEGKLVDALVMQLDIM
ncbi:MAG: ribosomal protein S18-alanine N-acetyltransferase [Halopseudomonas aestusnigri]